MGDDERHKELADFLRTCRANLSPEGVGLPSHRAHQRVKGLRREDVAELAAISVTWYTWLEQGRDIRMSEQVLHRIADALRLSPAQREYIFTLAIPEFSPDPELPREIENPRLQRILDQQGVNPALLLGRHCELLAWNLAAASILGNFEQMPPEDRNIVRLMFTEQARRLIVDWESHARGVLAEFRADSSRYLSEPWFTELIRKLTSSSPEFREWWPHHDVEWLPEGLIALDHPRLGRLVFEQTILHLHHTPEVRVVLYTPCPATDTAIKLKQ